MADCEYLQAICTDHAKAAEFAGILIWKLVDVHARYPLALLGFRHQSANGFHFLQIAGKGRATLGLALHEETNSLSHIDIATFPDAERHEMVLAGEALIDRIDIVEETALGAGFETTGSVEGKGSRLTFIGPRQSRVVRRVKGRLLVLRLARIANEPLPTRQFALGEGKIVHRASGDRRESRHEMMLALLGRMRRTDAAPVLSSLAQSGSEHLRWQALRECLALDTETGFATLSAIAGQSSDPLAPNAVKLREKLVGAYPQLARMGADLCPA